MGIACTDFSGNGEFDLLTTNFDRERNVLFSNLGAGVFADLSLGSVLDTSSRRRVGWGAVPLDADNDTRPDLFIANGHVTDMPDSSYAQLPLLYRGQPVGQTAAVNPGSYFAAQWHARGAFSADVAGDGRPDIIVCHIGAPPAVLRNDSSRNGDAVRLQFAGRTSNRDGSGTIVSLKIGDRVIRHQMIQSAGYLCSTSQTLHIPTGSRTESVELQIQWPSGITQDVSAANVGRTLLIREQQPALILPH